MMFQVPEFRSCPSALGGSTGPNPESQILGVHLCSSVDQIRFGIGEGKEGEEIEQGAQGEDGEEAVAEGEQVGERGGDDGEGAVDGPGPREEEPLVFAQRGEPEREEMSHGKGDGQDQDDDNETLEPEGQVNGEVQDLGQEQHIEDEHDDDDGNGCAQAGAGAVQVSAGEFGMSFLLFRAGITARTRIMASLLNAVLKRG